MISTLAEESKQPQQPHTQNAFTGGMDKNPIDMFKGNEGSYTHARNAANNLPDGQVGGLSTEPANSLCTEFPYPPIGFINLSGDQWMVFMTDDVHSEIGIFDDSQCSYTSITKGSQACLNFNRKNLITGAARRGFDCGYDVYWSDGRRNPDRFINTAKIPFIQDCTTVNNCVTCVDTNVLDCEKLRLAPHFAIPCLTLSKSQGGGTLLNSSCQVAMRYAINEIPCTDFVALSNIQSIFTHGNLAGALTLQISGAETSVFTEMEIVIVSMSAEQTQVKRLGIYSTRQQTIYIDDIDETLPNVNIALLPLSTPAIESSDSITSVANYLLRIGAQEKPEPNYQPYANQIITKWAAVLYPEDYYQKGGGDSNGVSYPMNVGYMQDEVYAYFIRGVYTSGDKTALYPIPGRTAASAPTRVLGGPSVPGSIGTYASGLMGGYESTEKYPDDQPNVWGNLCGEPIRHHRFPDAIDFPDLSHYSKPVPTPTGTTNYIRVMGVYFENIQPFRDNNGNIIDDIQGYEILRASREGHKSILAKGMINSMRSFTNPVTNTEGLYQNYPYNDLNPDYYLTSDVNIVKNGSNNTITDPNHNFDFPLRGVRFDLCSFHSPDTTFKQPYLGKGNLKIVQLMQGTSTGNFQMAYRHGKFKTITDFSTILGIFTTSALLAVDSVSIINTAAGGSPVQTSMAATDAIPYNFPLYTDAGYTMNIAGTDTSIFSKYFAGAINATLFIAMEPIKLKTFLDQMLTIITSLAPAREFAWQWNSAGRYNDYLPISGNSLFSITDYEYIKNNIQSFAGASVNNLYRNNYVALQLNRAIPILTSIVTPEYSRQTMAQRLWRPQDNDTFSPSYTDYIQSFYASYKVPQLSQYGQIGSTKNIPIGCMQLFSTTSDYSTSQVLFGGDTYINRYTEKNPFFFFNDWLQGAPDDFQYNYRNYINVPWPRYWIDNTKIHTDFLGLASKLRHLDAQGDGGNIQLIPFLPSANTYVKTGAFYLFCNGVRDFFVESEVNVGYRDWEDEIAKRFYDPYGFQEIAQMFRSDVIKSDILYKYDYSLSASHFYNQYLSWGQTLRNDYDPTLAYTCFAYFPRRVYYSLPQEEELKKDNWRVFLPNNYKDFGSKVTTIKSINKTGALILLDNDSPESFVGVDTLQSEGDVKIRIGDGGLFDQALQSITNADSPLGYGSCQNKLAVVNTVHGVFWISRDTGKVFCYGGNGLEEISTAGMKWWFSRYGPSQLLQQFPNYEPQDNSIAGIGIQIVYDSVNDILYICKKDYALRTPAPGQTQFIPSYDPAIGFYRAIFGAIVPIALTDTQYFQDASWTISYDCKSKKWISFHDWWPDLSIAGIDHFLTTKGTGLWRHSKRTDLFCNYYGVDYPFELEYYANTQLTEQTLQNVEYYLEAYRYRPNSTDKFLVYDENFDRAVIWNPEQNSDMLALNAQTWNNPYDRFNYPFFDTFGNRNIQYAKVENRYRFNDFYDLTKDRFQFGLGVIQAFNTDLTGYRWTLNPNYFDTQKSPIQQKRFRYMGTKVFLRRTVVGMNAMIMRYAVTKNIYSPR